MNKERNARTLPGIPTFLVLLVINVALIAAFAWWLIGVFIPAVDGGTAGAVEIGGIIVLILAIVAGLFLFTGLTPVNPNEARALVLFGHYSGTVRTQGLQYVNPFTERRRISVKVRNFETSKLKVNDHDGNPIEIAAIVVWKVTDTAEALFEVDDYENFVQVQAESALRNLATVHPYDAHREGDVALRANPVEIANQLRQEIQDRLEKAGVEVIEARISHLAYAPEIANAMLRRQQANAVIAARTRIVEGAVGMVEMALAQLSEKQVVNLDEERKAAMVSNLLVVLCSEHEAQPVLNAGTLYGG
ncbi:MAG: SPFH domain-containing protein [Chloroflexi bacterium]|jgi:regulator of protease activity HflC (stomatin/prohibitin superfamily)|nr:SPFH domain-containing protein [Chloroflexota bacterium]